MSLDDIQEARKQAAARMSDMREVAKIVLEIVRNIAVLSFVYLAAAATKSIILIGLLAVGGVAMGVYCMSYMAPLILPLPIEGKGKWYVALTGVAFFVLLGLFAILLGNAVLEIFQSQQRR